MALGAGHVACLGEAEGTPAAAWTRQQQQRRRWGGGSCLAAAAPGEAQLVHEADQRDAGGVLQRASCLDLLQGGGGRVGLGGGGA
jgi:hypothetical protein